MTTRSSLHTMVIESLIAGWLLPNEFAILEAVCDTLLPSLEPLAASSEVVVVAADSLHSPAVLLRSGLENQHIGRHLYLHPTATIGGFYPHKLYPWQGVLQSAYSDQFAHLDGNYGYKLEVAPGHPGLFLTWSVEPMKRCRSNSFVYLISS